MLYGQIVSTSYHYYADYDPDGDGIIVAGNGGAGLAGSELDIALIDLPTPVGTQTGWMQLAPDFTSGAVNLTAYPAIYSSVDLHPGNSGGPVWYIDGSGAHVAGVASTASWGAAVLGVYDQLLYWIAGNDRPIGGGGYE